MFSSDYDHTNVNTCGLFPLTDLDFDSDADVQLRCVHTALSEFLSDSEKPSNRNGLYNHVQKLTHWFSKPFYWIRSDSFSDLDTIQYILNSVRIRICAQCAVQ